MYPWQCSSSHGMKGLLNNIEFRILLVVSYEFIGVYYKIFYRYAQHLPPSNQSKLRPNKIKCVISKLFIRKKGYSTMISSTLINSKSTVLLQPLPVVNWVFFRQQTISWNSRKKGCPQNTSKWKKKNENQLAHLTFNSPTANLTVPLQRVTQSIYHSSTFNTTSLVFIIKNGSELKSVVKIGSISAGTSSIDRWCTKYFAHIRVSHHHHPPCIDQKQSNQEILILDKNLFTHSHGFVQMHIK